MVRALNTSGEEHVVRRAPLLLLTFALATTTGFALLGVGSTLSNTLANTSSALANKGIVVRFYDAVNAALATGDTAFLAQMLPANFVDQEPVSGLSPDRAGLLQYVTTLRATFPRLRLTAEALTAEGIW
jgi:hypothetical protein